MPVRRYQQEQWWRPEAEPQEVTLSYGYPLTTAVRDRSLTMKDARYGFYHGERSSGETTAQLSKDSFTVDTEVGEAEFVEAYGIHEVDSNKTHPAIALVRRSECNFSAGHLSGDPKEIVRKARETVDSLLHVLSFTEQNRLNWRRERASFTSEEGKPIGEIKTYRWVPPPSEGYRPNPSSLRNARKSFKAVCQAYADIDSTVRPVVEQAIENFKRTNCTDTLETKLVFWYSCLDHLTEELYDCDKGPFSKRLIDACEKAGVEIADLFNPKVVHHFREDLNDEHTCFWFVDARNRFVHDGLNALQDEPYRLIEATRNARALAERLLLSKLGINHNTLCDKDQFCLGEPTVRQ
ncbi:HEPN domain-containing protein [Salinibacter altiplanensis]|uniref:HEPN domain-containing protein n=1 Tax=Salinibacter altiplanensis TaxID=1803181 RepID=UPI000C9F3198|nr:hypothetical protein [Salinibacter altiplanensis]